MMLPIKFGFGASLGSGGQFMPWIHMDDLCNMYLSAIENKELEGIYNAVAPEHYTNQEFTTAIANTLQKPLWLPNIPAFIFKLLFGKMSAILLYGSKVSSQKIEKTGFQFKFQTVGTALSNLIG